MRRTLFALSCLIQFLGSNSFGQGVLGFGSYGFSGGHVGISSNFTIHWSILNGAGTREYFFERTYSTADIGSVFTISAGDAGFNNLVQLLTDGQSGHPRVTFDQMPIAGTLWAERTNEMQFFNEGPLGGNGIDFAGYEITAFNMRVNDMYFITPGRNPNGNGNWTDVGISTTFEVVGVPEPSSTTLLLGGVVAFGIFGYLKKFRARMR